MEKTLKIVQKIIYCENELDFPVSQNCCFQFQDLAL